MTENQLAVIPPQNNNDQLTVAPFGSLDGFELSQRMCKALCHSLLVPESYRGEGNLGNCIVAQDIAARTGFSILAVMQNLHVIEGRPAWSSPFIIGAVAASRRFSLLKFRVTVLGKKEVQYEVWTGPKGNRQRSTQKTTIEDKECVAWALDLTADGNREPVEGPAVSLSMAIAEGWYMRNGSKWKTMPDVMLRYRAAAFFGRLYVPEILMGMKTEEEIYDIESEVLPTIKDGGEIFPTSEPPRKSLPEVVAIPPQQTQTSLTAAQPVHRGRGRPRSTASIVSTQPPQRPFVEPEPAMIPGTEDSNPVEIDPEPEPEREIISEEAEPVEFPVENNGEPDPDIF